MDPRDPAASSELPPQAGTESPSGEEPADLRSLPKELGVLLMSAGVLGFVLPGPGTPAILAGGMILWPEHFGKVEGWVQNRYPSAHREGMKQIGRFLKDLNRRYPGSTGDR